MERLMKFAALGVAWIAWGCGSGNTAASDDAETEEEIVEQNLLYGIPADDYRIEHGEIAPGETMGRILNRYGVGAATVDRLDRAAKTDFPTTLRQNPPLFLPSPYPANTPTKNCCIRKEKIL